jgi:hypothetical protein
MTAGARLLNEVVGIPGTFAFLRRIERDSSTTAFPPNYVLEQMDASGVVDPVALLDDMLSENLLGWQGNRIGLTPLGIRTTLLAEALNGGDIRAVYERLSHHDVGLQMYELVREGMTRQFVESLVRRPGFGRLYICSPWINLGPRLSEITMHAVIQAETRRMRPEIWVITRPEPGTNDVPPPGVAGLRDLGAAVVLNTRLHTKLYIREPDANGGYSMAIVGSQNLTGSQYFELGIKINADSRLIGQLIVYFVDLMNASREPAT